jgi:hypothetical protein
MGMHVMRVIRILFRIGPVLLLVPLLLWAWVWSAIVPDEATKAQQWYIIPPMIALLILAALWHIALVVVEKGWRFPYLFYAIAHMTLFLLSG